jgi:hypothetical protein
LEFAEIFNNAAFLAIWLSASDLIEITEWLNSWITESLNHWITEWLYNFITS